MRVLLFLQLLALLAVAYASAGDRDTQFQQCSFLCNSTECTSQPMLPLALRLTRWTCLDNCRYNCMHEITSNLLSSGQKPFQYYGKWPFWRFAGMQEPASVLFSLLNLWAHVEGYSRVKKSIPRTHPLRSYYLTWSLASMNTWVWSAIFHTRDTPLTEKFDYFSAALTILTALYFTAIRFFHLYPTRSASSPKSLAWWGWTAICITAFTVHVLYLSLLPRFDYQYNIIFNLIIGMTHNVLWLLYSLPPSMSLLKRFPSMPKTYRPPFAGRAAVLVFLTTTAMAFELFDFPPWGRIIDAHALWHLSTVPIAFAWYRFLIRDATDPSWREDRRLQSATW